MSAATAAAMYLQVVAAAPVSAPPSSVAGAAPLSACLARPSTSCIGRHAVQALMATGRTFCAQQAIARLRELSRLRIGPMVVSCFSIFQLNSMLQNLPNFVQI
jgi:hypothetical protein